MSKDMLGPVIRAAVGVPQDRLETLAKIASAMAADNPNGGAWHEQFSLLLKESKPSVLHFHKELSVGPLVNQFVPNEFFKTRPGLYLWNEMQRVLKNAKTVNPAETAATKLRSFDLTKNAYDREIKAELPKQHEVDLWQIAELIGKQKNGEAGPLLTNGNPNIFYVSAFAVVVRWFAGGRLWRVGGWLPGDGYWREGFRVFSCN